MAVTTYTDDTLPAGERPALPSAADAVAALARAVEISSRPSTLTGIRVAGRHGERRSRLRTFLDAAQVYPLTRLPAASIADHAVMIARRRRHGLPRSRRQRAARAWRRAEGPLNVVSPAIGISRG
jgi:hypothetical protein